MQISLPFADQIRSLTPQEEHDLRASIHSENAVHVSIVVDKFGRLLDGYNRLRLALEMAKGCALCDKDERPPHRDPLDSIQIDIKADVDTDAAAIALANDLNDIRRHFTEVERHKRASARAARAVQLRQGGLTLQQVADTVGVDEKQVRRYLAQVEPVSDMSETAPPDYVTGKDGKQYPATKRRTTVHASNAHEAGQALSLAQMTPVLPPGQHTVDSARKAQDDENRIARHEERLGALVAPSFDPRTGPFPVIYADPPWRYEKGTTTPNRTIEQQYPTMALADICTVEIAPGQRVADIAGKDGILFLWSTAPKLHEALQVMIAWGYDYRTCMIWRKSRKGLGNWVRVNHELLLIGRRGAMPTPLPAVRPDSVFDAPVGEHSAKPARVYEIIERMYPGVPRLELFARGTPREGWTTWGNEVMPHSSNADADTSVQDDAPQEASA